MTQEELLAECEETEKENISSLEKFRRMELEKKRCRPTKSTTYTGPIIRYHSTSMPVIDDGKPIKEISATEEGAATPASDDKKSRTTRRSRLAATDAAKAAEKNRCERTFISFVNDLNNTVFDSIFPPKKVTNKRKYQELFCHVSKRPAKYVDPVTQLPYYGPLEFKIIREGYYIMLETKNTSSDDPEINKWLEWRKRSNEQKLKKSLKSDN